MVLVKIKVNDDGERYDRPKWCVMFTQAATNRNLCSGEAVGIGDSSAVFETKRTGKVTCPECIEYLKHFKTFKY